MRFRCYDSAPPSMHPQLYFMPPPPPPQWICYPTAAPLAPPAQFLPPPYTPSAAPPRAPKKKSRRPTLLPGAHYVWPAKHAYVHTIMHTKVWESAAGATRWRFRINRVPCGSSVAELMEAVGAAAGCKATEVVEVGDGRFVKGVCLDTEKKRGATLASLGWDERRGGERPPIWLVLHD